MEEATKFAESTQVLMNVSEFTDVSKATDSLISSIQAFKYTAEESMGVVDILNEIGNNYAISTADLAESLTKSSGSLVAANGTLEEAVALTATANTIIQDSDVVGTALKTVAMRLRGTSTKEMEEEGLETDGAITSKSKLQSKVKGLSGVDILTDTGAYKSTYQILSEIADVWEDISDIDQAALLELLAGKRAGSVMAAILQNPETLKDAFESASEASGSALVENEKYMDSIQGRIDQFNNALQTMWNNELGGFWIKLFVDLGKVLIQTIDKIGLLGSAIIVVSLAIMKMNKMNLVEYFTSINAGLDGWALKLKNLVTGSTAATSATSTMTAATIEASVANGTLSATQAAAMATANGLTLAQTRLTASEAAELLTKGGMNQAEALNLVSKLKLTAKTKELTAATVEATMAQEGYTAAQINSAKASLFGSNIAQTTKQLYSFTAVLKGIPAMVNFGYMFGGIGGAFSQLGKGLGMLWGAIPIVGKIMLIVGAVTLVVKGMDALITTTEEYAEKLKDLKSELESMQSELDSLNSELETTQSRMSELLAMDSLTFTEQEELKNLQKQNDALERQIYLLEQRQKRKQKETEEIFVKTVGGDLEYSNSAGGMLPNMTTKEYIEGFMDSYVSAKESVDIAENALVQAEKKLENAKTDEEKKQAKKEVKAAQKEYDQKKREADVYYDYVSGKIEEYAEYADGIDYDVADDETKKLLDYIYDLEDTFNIINGDDKAKEIGIKRIFNKEEFADEAEQINKYVDALKAGDTSATESIKSIINNNEELKQALANIGLDPQTAIDYFTQIGSSLGLGEVEAKIKDVEEAGNTLQDLLNGMKNGTSAIKAEDLFDADGKVIKNQISEIFQGIDEEIVADISKLLEKNKDAILDGTVDINKLMAEYSIEGAEQIINAQKNVFAARTIELFPNLKDDISGIIDTFDELAKAIGDVSDAMDTLDQARKEEAHSGSVSIETLSELMKYTDDYAKIVSIDETGAIHLAADAEKQLTEQKIQAIKDSAALAVQEAELALEKAKLAEGAVNAASAIGKTFVSALRGGAGVVAYVTTLVGSMKQAFSGWDWKNPIESAKNINFDWNAAKSAASKAKADAEAGSAAANWLEASLPKSQVENAEKNLEKAKDNQKIANGITSDNIQKRYQSDKADGSDKEEDDRLENIQKKYEGKIQNLENQNSWLENEIAREEEIGLGVSKSYYEEKIDIEEKLIDEYEKERAELIELQKLYPEGSEKWYEVANAIWEVEHSMQESTTNIISYGKEIIAIYDEIFSKIGEAYDDKISISDDRIASMQNYAEILELQGGTATKGLYDAMITENKGKMATQWEQFYKKEDIIAKLSVEVNPHEEGTDEWEAFELAREQGIIAASEEQRQLKLDIQATEKEVLQLEEDFKELAITIWDEVRAAYDLKDQFFVKQQDLAQSYMDRLGVLNINVPDDALKEMANIQGVRSANFLKDYKQAYAELANLEQQVGTDDERYIEKALEVSELYEKWYDSETERMDYEKQILDNRFDRFNQLIDRINHSTDTLQKVSDLLGDEDVATENGEWTAEGLTRLGVAHQQMAYSKQSIEEINDEMEYYDTLLKRGKISEKEHAEKMQELSDRQWDAIDAYESQKDAIVELEEARIDLIEEGINKEIEAYQELIDLKKEELDAERDLYDFKKDVEKQTRDMAALERKIASMSGSTDAATIAERTKLEAQLREARDGLDDTYYSHGMDSMSKALDDELESFTKSSEDYIESLRESIKDVDLLVETTFNKVIENGTIVLETLVTKSGEYGVTLDANLTDPWENGAISSKTFMQSVDLHFQEVDRIISGSSSKISEDLSKPYKDQTDGDGATLPQYRADVLKTIDGVITDAEGKQEELRSALDGGFKQAESSIQGWGTTASNAVDSVIKKFTGENGLLAALNKTADRINSMPTYDGGYTEPTAPASSPTSTPKPSSAPTGGVASEKSGKYNANLEQLQTILVNVFNKPVGKTKSGGLSYTPDGLWGSTTSQSLKEAKQMAGIPFPDDSFTTGTKSAMQAYINKEKLKFGKGVVWGQKWLGELSKVSTFAKGTLGTKTSGFAITDESWIGEEITLAAGKNGQLQYLKKGSAVMPADISANLVEWGKLDPTMMNLGDMSGNVQLMSNYVNKPEIKLDIENFLNVGTVSKDTLPELEKLMDRKIDTFAKQLNASIRKFK